MRQMKSIPVRSRRSTHWNHTTWSVTLEHIYKEPESSPTRERRGMQSVRERGLTSWVPWRLRRWSHRLTFSKKVLNRLKPEKQREGVSCQIVYYSGVKTARCGLSPFMVISYGSSFKIFSLKSCCWTSLSRSCWPLVNHSKHIYKQGKRWFFKRKYFKSKFSDLSV